jgi:hypothetical protein
VPIIRTMKKVMAVIAMMMLVSCGGTAKTATWDDVYKLIDSNATQSVIDRTVYEIGVDTHPASQAVASYFDYFMTLDAQKAWEYIAPDSPFAKQFGSVNQLRKIIKDGMHDNDYISLIIKGINISKKDENNQRTVIVQFDLKVFDKIQQKHFDSLGNYIVKEHNGKWLIYDIVKPQNVNS